MTSCKQKYAAFIAFITSILLGCASGGANTAKYSSIEKFDAFKSASIKLQCNTACSYTWGTKRRSAKTAFSNKDWQSLFYIIEEVGFNSDLTYFYLARSAEGLNYFKAAKQYYLLSQSAEHKCNGIINNCDGFDVPAQVNIGLVRVEKLINRELLLEKTARRERMAQEEILRRAEAEKIENESRQRLLKEEAERRASFLRSLQEKCIALGLVRGATDFDLCVKSLDK